MRRERVIVFAVAFALVLVAATLLTAPTLAMQHVRAVTGKEDVESVSCMGCHLSRSEPAPPTRIAHPDPGVMVVSPDDATVHVACASTGEILEIDAGTGEVGRRVKLAGPVRGLAISPDGRTLAASLFDEDQVVLLDAGTLAISAHIDVAPGPVGLAFGDGGERLAVAASVAGMISIVDTGRRRELRRLAAGREPFAVCGSPDGRHVAVASRMATIARPEERPAAEITIVDIVDETVTSRILLDSCHQSESLVYTPDGAHILAPAIRIRNLLPIVQVARGWVMSSVLAVITVETGAVVTLPLGSVNRGFPDPSGIAITSDGRQAFVASAGIDRVARVDVPALLRRAAVTEPDDLEDLAASLDYLREEFVVGDVPHSLALCASGNRPMLVVSERLDDAIAFYEPEGELVRRSRLGASAPDDRARAGERVFHDASYAFQSAFSCRSCHPDGHTDGLTYDFDIDGVGLNVVLNRSLRGVTGTAPFKWIGLNRTLADQCGPRFAKVLTRADPFPQERLEELVEFIDSLPTPRPQGQAGRMAALDPGSVARGRAIFDRSTGKDGAEISPEGRCTTCHPAPRYSNFMKADVGTKSSTDGTGNFDVPHLTGIASKAPYLHDGRATTLEEVWTLPGVDDQHGFVTDLSKADLNDLINFLRGL